MAAVQNNSYFLKYAAEEMQNDKEVVMAAVQNTGCALEYAGEEMQNDKEVVMAAVQNNGCALEYAAEEMQNDKEVVMAAVQNDGFALKYAAKEVVKELQEEAQSFHITIQEYAHAAAHPIIIQLFSSDESDSAGYGGAPFKISCRDLVGNEVR